MKRSLLTISALALFMALPVGAAPVTKDFILPSNAFTGTVTSLPSASALVFDNGSLIFGTNLSNITGQQITPVISDLLKIDPSNKLVLRVKFYADPAADDTATTKNNLIWTIEEWTPANVCADRDSNSIPGPCGLVAGQARVFSKKSIATLANSQWSGTSTIEEADDQGARHVISNLPFPVPRLGEIKGTVQIKIKFNADSSIKTLSFPGNATGFASNFINPVNGGDQLTFKLKIKSAK